MIAAKAAGIIDEYGRGIPLEEIQRMFHVSQPTVYRVLAQANMPRRKCTRSFFGRRFSRPRGHEIPAAVKLARMRSSATWRAFFQMVLEGHGPAYSIHVIHTLRRQIVGSGERAEVRAS